MGVNCSTLELEFNHHIEEKMAAQVQIRGTAEFSNVNQSDNSTPSKMSSLNGRNRHIERIRIDDPAGIDPLIRKYSEDSEGSTLLSVAMLVAFAVLVAGAIAASLLIAPWLLPVILFPGYLAITVPVECMERRERDFKELKVKCLKDCKQAMGNEEFRNFAHAMTGQKELTPDQILLVHGLFKESKSIDNAARKFERDKAHLAQQIASARIEI